MPKIHKIKLLPILVIIALIAGSIGISNVNAAAVTDMVTTSSDQTAGSTTTLTSSWTLIDALAGGDVITMTYGASSSEFDISTVTVLTDVTITDTTTGAAASYGADCTGTDPFSLTLSGQTIVITACAGDYAGESSGNSITVAVANVTNGLSTNSPHAVSFAGTTYTDTGTSNVPVIDSQSVSVTATVDPTITFTLWTDTLPANAAALDAASSTGTTAVSLGNLSSGTVNTGDKAIIFDLDTNANGGAVVNVASAYQALRHADYATNSASIASGAAGLLSATADGYGLCVALKSSVSGTVGYDTAGNYDGATGTGCSTSDHTVGQAPTNAAEIIDASASGNSLSSNPLSSARAAILVKAAVDATTPAGSYSDTLTFTAVGTF